MVMDIKTILNRVFAILGISAVHYIAFTAALSVAWIRAEKLTHARTITSPVDGILWSATEVLAFPLTSLCHLPMVANSILWGTMILFAVILIRAKKQSKHP
jgi:hypothetical protein